MIHWYSFLIPYIVILIHYKLNHHQHWRWCCGRTTPPLTRCLEFELWVRKIMLKTPPHMNPALRSPNITEAPSTENKKKKFILGVWHYGTRKTTIYLNIIFIKTIYETNFLLMVTRTEFFTKWTQTSKNNTKQYDHTFYWHLAWIERYALW